jgi:exonuclease I
MKLLNTKDLKRLLEEGAMEFQDLFDTKDETAGPCREIKIEREHNRVVLLVDHRELMSQTFDRLGIKNSLSLEQIDIILSLWRTGEIEKLRKYLKLEEAND